MRTKVKSRSVSSPLVKQALGEESDWAKKALACEFTDILSLEPHIDL
jgi:hypothetical protein